MASFPHLPSFFLVFRLASVAPASQPLNVHMDSFTNPSLLLFSRVTPLSPWGMKPPIMSTSFSPLPHSLRRLLPHLPSRPFLPASPHPHPVRRAVATNHTMSAGESWWSMVSRVALRAAEDDASRDWLPPSSAAWPSLFLTVWLTTYWAFEMDTQDCVKRK